MTSEVPPATLRALAADHKMRDWVRDALCAEVDQEIFFPEKGGSAVPAKAICNRCPVLAACREYSLSHPTILEGIWGGLSQFERREERRKRGLPNSYASGDIARKGCGTAAGYKAHYRRAEFPCDACRKAEKVRREMYG